MVVAVLSSAGDQLPVIELLEVVGKADSVAPEQIAGTAVNVGVTVAFTFTVTVSVLTTPHELVTDKVSTMLPDALAAKV